MQAPEEKISYLYSVKVDINRIIKCFSSPKFQALKKYAVKNIFAEDGCEELTDFLREIIGYYNSPLYGDRYISDEILKRHLKQETIKYKNFLKIVDSEIEHWINVRDKHKSNSKKKIEEKNMNDIEKKEENLDSKESSTSIRELRESSKKISWHGSNEDLIHFFDQLFSQQLLNIKSYDEIFSIASHYFVDKDGNPIIVEKSASAKLNLHGPKIPSGYQRYMKSIEKLKAE